MLSGRLALRYLVFIAAMLMLMSAVAYCDGPTLIPGVIHKPMPVLKEDCIKFDPNQVEAKQISGAWKVVQGDMWMLDFGSSEENAKKAVDIIKFYKMDSQCFVGRPDAPMQYYLVGGKAPEGPFPGEDALNFDPASTEAKKIGSDWRVVDGGHSMMDFGASEANAKTAVNVIKKYGFNHICFVGRPNAPMMYFRKDKGIQKVPIKLPGDVIGPVKPPVQPSSYITVQLVAQPDDYTGKYPVTIIFNGKIKSDRACEVQYTFTRSDGATGPVKKLKFKGAATKSVGTSWTLSADYTGWQTLKILSPVEVESAKAQFTVRRFAPLKPGLPPKP